MQTLILRSKNSEKFDKNIDLSIESISGAFLRFLLLNKYFSVQFESQIWNILSIILFFENSQLYKETPNSLKTLYKILCNELNKNSEILKIEYKIAQSALFLYISQKITKQYFVREYAEQFIENTGNLICDYVMILNNQSEFEKITKNGEFTLIAKICEISMKVIKFMKKENEGEIRNLKEFIEILHKFDNEYNFY